MDSFYYLLRLGFFRLNLFDYRLFWLLLLCFIFWYFMDWLLFLSDILWVWLLMLELSLLVYLFGFFFLLVLLLVFLLVLLFGLLYYLFLLSLFLMDGRELFFRLFLLLALLRLFCFFLFGDVLFHLRWFCSNMISLGFHFLMGLFSLIHFLGQHRKEWVVDM